MAEDTLDTSVQTPDLQTQSAPDPVISSAPTVPDAPLRDPQGPGDPVTPGPVKSPPSYKDAMNSLLTKSASANPFYGSNVLTGTQVDYAPTKKYLDQAYGYSPNRDNEDFYAQKQGFGSDLLELGAAVALKLPALAVTKTIGGLGYVAGLLNPTNWNDKNSYIGSVADNGISKWAASAETAIKEQFLPTFQEASDNNKGFFARAFTDEEFWTSDVLDGAAFMASAFIPGMALAKLGAGTMLTKALSGLKLGANAAGDVVNGLEVAQNYLGSAKKIADGFDAATTWAMATTSEAMYEATDVRNNVLGSLDKKINPKTGMEYTDDEKKVIAGGAAKNTFLLNTMLLGATNAIQMKYLYKALGMTESQVGKIAAKAGAEGFERVEPVTKWGKFLDSSYGAFAKGVAVETLSEGYVEENVQLAIQRMNQEYGAAGKIAGVQDYFGVLQRSLKQAKDATLGNDAEAASNIGIGAIMGAVVGGIGDVKEHHEEKLKTNEAIAQLNKTQQSWLKFGNLYQTTEEDELGENGEPTGNKVSKLKLDENHQPVVDQGKLADIITDFSNNTTMTNIADRMKDQNQAKFMRDLSFRNFVHAHIDAGIEDTLLKKLDDAANASPDALAKMGFDPASSVSEVGRYKTLASQIIDQDKLIKGSILTNGPEHQESARLNHLTNLADQQSILNGIATDIDGDSNTIKSKMISPETSSLSDLSVDGANAINYRIKAQENTIEALKQQKGSNFKVKIAEQLLGELNKQKDQFIKNDSLEFEKLTPTDTGFYNYENPTKAFHPLNVAYQQSILEKAQYQNVARSMGLEFASIADTKNGLKNYKQSITEDVVNPINTKNQEEAVKDNLNITDPQLDPNDPRIKEIQDRRDDAIDKLHDLYEEDDEHAVSLDKDGVTLSNIKTGVDTKLEDVVPGQISDQLKSQLDDVQKRILKIGEDSDQEIKNLGQTDPVDPNNPVSDPSVGASQTNLKDFYVFDGQNIKPGLVFQETSSGDKWTVKSESPFKAGQTTAIKVELLDKQGNPTGRTTNLKSLEGFTLNGLLESTTKTTDSGEETTTNTIKPSEVVKTKDLNAPNKFKIQRENELIRIYPYQNVNGTVRESIPAAQKRLDNLLKSTTREELANGSSMTISRGTNTQTSLAGDATGNPNGNLQINPDSLTVQMEFNGEPIGFITNYNHYSVKDKNDRDVPIEKLTVSQFSEIFDTAGKDPKLALEAFKQNFRKGQRLFRVLNNLLGKADSVKISNDDLSKMLDLNISTGEFDFVDEDHAATLSDLSSNQINGHTYVIDRVRKYDGGKFVTNPIAITTATGTERRQIEKEIKDAQSQGRDLTSQLGRYVAVVKMPNGVVRFVELSTDHWSSDQIDSLVTKINERSELSKKNNLTEKESQTEDILGPNGKFTKPKYTGGKDETYNDELNKEIASTLFLALPKANRGTYIDMYVNAVGNLQLKINQPQGEKTIKHSIIVKKESNESPLDFKDTDDMLARINKAIIDYNKTAKTPEQAVTVTLTRDNFKVSIPNEIGTTEANGMRTTVSPDIVKNVSLTYNTKDTVDSVVPAKVEAEPIITVSKTGGQNYEVDPKVVAALNQEFAGGPVDPKIYNELFGPKSIDSKNSLQKGIDDLVKNGDKSDPEINFLEDYHTSESSDVLQKVSSYKINDYGPINSLLRKGIKVTEESLLNELGKQDNEFNREGVKSIVDTYNSLYKIADSSFIIPSKNITVYRNVFGKENDSPFRNTKVGDIVDNPSFTSTTVDPIQANSSELSKISNSIINIELSAGLKVNGFYVGGVEKEFILPPDTKILITGKGTRNGITMINAKIVDSTTSNSDIRNVPNPLQTKPVKVYSFKEQADQIKADKLAYIQSKSADFIGLGIGKSKAIIQATKEANAIYDTKLKELTDKLGIKNGRALKVLERENFDQGSVENLGKFNKWVKDNLPEFISVQEVNDLSQNMSANNITVGMFTSYLQKLQDGNTTIKGRIRVGADTPFKYHEAFHAVFRLLSTDKQIDQLLDIAKREVKANLSKQGTNLKSALEAFKQLHPMYDTMTSTELEQRFYEEHLADRFDDWKSNKAIDTSHVVKGLFAKILDWIKRVFSLGSSSDLESRFGEIDNGKYRNSNLANNVFTREESNMTTDPALKVIKVGEEIVKDENGNDIVIDRNLSQQEGDQLAASVTSVFYDRLGQSEQYNKKDLLNTILDEYAELYDIDDKAVDYYSSEMDRLFPNDNQYNDSLDYQNRVRERYKIFSDPDNRQSLMEAVDVHLRMMGFKQSLESDEFDNTTDDYGDRITTDNWKETHSIGGFGSLSQFLRQYIATTTYEYTDEFGNNQLKDGVPLLQAVNANLVYNGMLKAVSNIGDQNMVMNRLRLLQSEDTETGKFINKFFNDTGIDFNEDGSWYSTNPNRARLIQQVIKGFNQYSVDYIFLNKDIREDAQITHAMVANRRDMAKTQFSMWQNAYVRVFEDQAVAIKDKAGKAEFYNQRVEPLQDLYTLMQKDQPITDTRLEIESKAISNLLKDNIGISLDPTFLKFSILSNKDRTLLTDTQTTLVDAYNETYYATREDISQIIRAIQSGENPFAKNIDDDNNQVEEELPEKEVGDLGKGGTITRMNNLAKGNSAFDETVYSSSWKNADGELVYTHQLPTYHLVRVQQLNSDAYLDTLRQDPFLEKNMLLNSDEFAVLQGDLKVSRIDGNKSSVLTLTEDGASEDKTLSANKNKGITYGKFSDREFLTTLFDLYAYGKEYKSENGSFRTSQHLIRVLESSNTGDTLGLPIIKAAQPTKSGGTELTDQAVDILHNEIKNEFDRIKRVQKEISYITSEDGKLADQIDGYHYGTDKDTGKRNYTKGRGLQFYKTGLMLGDLKSQLEASAADDDFDISSKSGAIKTQIRNYWKQQTQEMVDLMTSSGVISKDSVDLSAGERQTYTNKLIDKFIQKGFTTKDGNKESPDERRNSLMNIVAGNLEHNVSQVLVNDYINTMSLNQLLLGDQAQSLKDSVDEVKRAKGANGSGASLESTVLSPSVGINEPFINNYILQFEDPLYRSQYSGEKKEKADAQMWGTPKSMRYTLHGLGKLDPFTAKMLDKIEEGKPLTAKEIFGYTDSATSNKVEGLKDLHAMFNSMKLVYYDGKQYIKTSFVMLTKELTSYKENGEWKALPGKEDLHNMREKLEDFENRNNTVTYAVPKSASKGLKVNIAGSANEATDHNFHQQETKFWRLQLENPSNKLQITDPTQAKQLILAEQNDATKVNFRGTETSVGVLKQLYLADTAQRLKNNYVTARNEIFDIKGAFDELASSIDLGKVTSKLAKFQSRAIDSLRSSGADSQTIEFFELGKDGQPKYNLNNPVTLDKYTQLFLAYFSKGVMSEKVPGHSVALMSNYGHKVVKRVAALDPVTNQPTRWDNIRTDEVRQNPHLYDNAAVWNNEMDRQFDGLKVGDHYIDDLRHNVPEFDEKGNITGRYSEFVMPAHYAELMNLQPGDNIPEAVQKAFGVRIPSQDKHSTITLRMIDTMPAFYGSTAIFPHELIDISGADFDIDKLYMHIADTYVKDGKLAAYGTATTPEDKFNEYVEYLRTNNKDFKTAVSQLRQDIQNTTIEDDITPGEAAGLFNDALSMESISDNMFIYKEALRMLGLPSNPKSYVDTVANSGELNNGVLNNRILEQKINLVNNEHMTAEQPGGKAPIAFEVASVDPLKDIVNELVRDFANPDSPNYVKEISDIVSENPTDTDSMLGKYKAYKNNKEGSRNIGPAVNSILAYSVMSSFNIDLRKEFIQNITSKIGENGKKYDTAEMQDMFLFELNGHKFDSYSPKNKEDKQALKAFDPQTGDYTGDRIFGAISTVVSAMTDNAKERLAARLGLNIEAIGYLTNMLAQGVPMKSAIRFLLQPSIREYFSQVKIASNKIKTGTEQQIKKSEILKDIMNNYKPEEETDIHLTDDKLNEGLSTNGADRDLQYTILKNFSGIINQSQAFNKVARVLKLTKGLGTNFEGLAGIKQTIEELGLRMSSDKEFNQTQIPFDLRQTFMATNPRLPYHEFMNNYIKTADQIDHLSQSMFLEKTPVFQRISQIVRDNLNVKGQNQQQFDTTLKRDLISYLSIKAYMKTLDDQGRYRTLASLDNAMIYDEAAKNKPEEFNDIIDTFKAIRTQLPDNYFASKFVNVISTQRTNNAGEVAMNDLNRDGINKAEANTWAKLSEYQVEKIKDSFLEIYQNDATRENAVDIFNYLLVKDAGQFKSNSFIRFIPTFMFNDLLKSTGAVNDVLKMPITKDSKQAYTNLFGVDSPELFDQFMRSYTSHIGNSYEITKLFNGVPKYDETIDKTVKNYTPKSFVKTGPVPADLKTEVSAREQLFGKDTKKEAAKPVVDTRPGITINLFAGIRDKAEAFDTGTTDGIIYLKNKGTYNDTEKAMLAKNRRMLESKGFPTVRGQFGFPYVIVDSNIQGKRSYYKLVSVLKDNEKGDKISGSKQIVDNEAEDVPSRLINPGETIATGIGARYVEYQPTGSRKSTMIGELFGPVPVVAKNPRVRKQFSGAENTGRYSAMSAGDIADRMGLGDVKEQIPKVSQKSPTFSNTNVSPVDVLSTKFGITTKMTNKGVSYEGPIWDEFTPEMKAEIRTPADLLTALGYNDQDSAEPISYQSEPSPEAYQDIPLPSQELSDTVDSSEMTDEDDNFEPPVFNVDAIQKANPKADPNLLAKLFGNPNNPLNDDCA